MSYGNRYLLQNVNTLKDVPEKKYVHAIIIHCKMSNRHKQLNKDKIKLCVIYEIHWAVHAWTTQSAPINHYTSPRRTMRKAPPPPPQNFSVGHIRENRLYSGKRLHFRVTHAPIII